MSSQKKSTVQESKKLAKNRRPGRRARARVARRDDDDRITVSGNGNVVRNRGDYTFPLFHLLGSLFGGLDLSSLFGSQEGDGRGDYKIKKNSLILAGQPPVINSNEKMDFHRIQHREYLGPVSSAASNGPNGSSFQVVAYSLNPGLPSLLPWGSGIADNYEEYEIMGMVVCYRPTSGNATGANTTLGEVLIATNYNAGAPNFANAQQMLNSEYATQTKPSDSAFHMIECEPHKNPVSELYVRTGSVPTGEDVKTYDLGKLQVATQGCQTNSQQLGEIWITYDIAFYKPVLGGIGSGNSIPTDHFQLTAVASTTPLGTSQVQVVGEGALGGVCNGATGTIYSFPNRVVSGTYFVMLTAAGTAAAYTAPTLVSNFNYSVLQVWSTTAGPDAKTVVGAPAAGVSSATIVHAFIIEFSANIPTVPVQITWGAAGSLPTGTCNGDLIVTQVNSNLVSLVRGKQLTPEMVSAIVADKVDGLVEERVREILERKLLNC